MLAPNPGPFTGEGTNSYVVGDEAGVAVVDPGPVDELHRRRILEAVAGRPVTAVVVTHAHSDHAPLANPLATQLGAPAFGYAAGPDFDPDVAVEDGGELPAGGARLIALHTPGHSPDHLCLRAGTVLFTGDHILGGSSAMVEDVVAYLASLERLRGLELTRLYPGHGPEIERPAETIEWYIAHRRERETEIAAAVVSGCRTVGEVVERVYHRVDPAVHPLAAHSVAAHLRKLASEGRVRLSGEGWEARVEPLGS